MITIPQAIDPRKKGSKVRQVWTPAEDALLARAVQIETPQTGSISWCSVAAHLPNRNNKDCRKRWHYSIAHGHTIRKGTWTREEDQRLRDAVVIHGTRWSKIAQVVGTRNGDQCWKRWYDCLDPQIDKSPWTPEEDEKLLRTVAKHGRNWTGIVNKHFPKRTSLSAKNRYSILQRKQELRSNSQGPTSRQSPASSTRSSPGVQPYTHMRNPSSESGTGPLNNGGFGLTTTTESGYDSIPHQHHQFQPMPDYWTPTHTTVPSGSSTPDSAHADLVGVGWPSTLEMTSPDPSGVSYMDSASYLSPSPMPIHSPRPDYSMVGGFFNPMNGLGTAAMHATSPGTSSYSPVYGGGMMGGAAVSGPNTQYMVCHTRRERRCCVGLLFCVHAGVGGDEV